MSIRELALVVDERLAELHGASDVLSRDYDQAEDNVRRTAGQDRDWQTKRWSGTLADALKATPEGYKAEQHRDAVAALNRILAKMQHVQVEIRELNEVWEEERWSRFFLVRGGHIHSGFACHTLRPTTDIGWLPDLSGLTEADAVAAHGCILCTHCFPSAPVEWTRFKHGEKDPSEYCPGSGGAPVPSEKRRMRYAECPECGNFPALTTYGLLRKHKPPKD